MSNLVENNSKRVLLNTYFWNVFAFVYLVFPENSEECPDEYIQVKVGNKRTIKIPGRSTKNVRFLTYKKITREEYEQIPEDSHSILDYSPVEDYVDSDNVIDLMKYLQEKKIGTIELDSKEFSTARRRKVKFEDISIHRNGLIFARHAFLGTAGYNVTVEFLTDEVVIGKMKISSILLESLDEKALTYLLDVVDHGKNFTSEDIGELLRMGFHHVYISTMNGTVHYNMLFGAPLELEMEFEDGSYHFAPYDERETIISKQLTAFVLGLLQAKSWKECMDVECKAKLLGVI